MVRERAPLWRSCHARGRHVCCAAACAPSCRAQQSAPTSTDDSASTSADALMDATALMTARRAADAYRKRAPPRTK